MDFTNIIFRHGKIRNLSPRTIKSYTFCVGKFLRRFPHKQVKQISKKDVEQYLFELSQKKRSAATINLYHNAIKFFFHVGLKKRLLVHVPSAKVEKRIPEYLNQEETKQLFSCIHNQKHLLMIKLLYSSGMRVSELVNLKVKDLENSHGWVRQGKGAKDRPFIIAKRLQKELSIHIIENTLKPKSWLFPARDPLKHLTVRTVQSILKIARKKAKISKTLTPHTLRHSFATHLLQNGYAITDLQPLLGHNRLDTTMIYVHMAAPQILRTKSPLDEF